MGLTNGLSFIGMVEVVFWVYKGAERTMGTNE